jgi:hypothetical protein
MLLLLRVGAGVAVDFGAQRDFDDFRGFPAHPILRPWFARLRTRGRRLQDVRGRLEKTRPCTSAMLRAAPPPSKSYLGIRQPLRAEPDIATQHALPGFFGSQA